jgi:hypothetical protein
MTAEQQGPDAWLVEWNAGTHEKLCANEHEAERESLILVEDGWEDVEVIPLFRAAAVETSAPPYEMNDRDRAIMAKVQKAVRYLNNGDPLKDAIDDYEVAEALELLTKMVGRATETGARICGRCSGIVLDPDPNFCVHCGAAFGGRFHVKASVNPLSTTGEDNASV